MMPDRGAVLINALVVVLTIAAIAAALLTRSEAARLRAGDSQVAEQLDLYLDAAERLVPQMLDEIKDGDIVHPEQSWTERRIVPIDRGQVAVDIQDLQGRLNVNWLLREDDYVAETFRTIFASVDVPASLILELRDFLSPSGPRGSAYLNRRPPIWPRGGAVKVIDDLRAVEGMQGRYFDALLPVLTALPPDTRINLNTAPKVVKQAVIAPLPPEMVSDIMTRQEPLSDIASLRRQASEILETESLEALQLERMTVTSMWFRADLVAELDGRTLRRAVIFRVRPGTSEPIRRVYRWALYD